MHKITLVAAATFSLLAGAAMAETTSTMTTTTSTVPSVPMVAPVPGTMTNSMSDHTVDADGNVTDRSKSVTTKVSPFGDSTTTRRTTETTTAR